MKIVAVAGARPNFVKIAPILRAFDRCGRDGPQSRPPFEWVLVHTGQHYDHAMSASFFADLGMAAPHHNLCVGSASHAAQTAEIMRRFEPLVLAERPDLVLVVGDVNSTAACAMTAAKLGCRVAHVEAGLRSFDRKMPEEINRVVTDALADLLFTTEESANDNLRREGHSGEQIFFVGNVMIDSLLWCRDAVDGSTILDRLNLDVNAPGYALVTLHRAESVDDAGTLAGILRALAQLAGELPVLLPAHPRTRARLVEFGLAAQLHDVQRDGAGAAFAADRIGVSGPLPYVDFLRLLSKARVVLTDSGGIQDETTYLGVPCLTLRHNTERPVTLSAGTNVLVGTDPEDLLAAARRALAHPPARPPLPALWDGHAAERIAAVLAQWQP